MIIELIHPKNQKLRVRIRVSNILVDRRDLLMVTISDQAIAWANRTLSYGPGDKITVSDLLEQIKRCTYQIRFPVQNRNIRILSRPQKTEIQKIQEAIKKGRWPL